MKHGEELMKMTNHALLKGDKVNGKYFGIDYSGVIVNKMVVGNYATRYLVKLDAPISLYTSSTDTISVTQNIKHELNKGFTDYHFINKSE